MVIKIWDFIKHNIVVENMKNESNLEQVTLDLHVGEAYKKLDDYNRYGILNKMVLKPTQVKDRTTIYYAY